MSLEENASTTDPENKQTSGNNSNSLSSQSASILLYCFTVGVLGILAGIVLSAYDRLPSQIAAIAGTIGGLISLISGIFGSVIVQSVPKGIKSIWQNAHRLIAISSGILTLIALILVVILVPFVNAALFPSPKTETYPPFENMVRSRQ